MAVFGERITGVEWVGIAAIGVGFGLGFGILKMIQSAISGAVRR